LKSLYLHSIFSIIFLFCFAHLQAQTREETNQFLEKGIEELHKKNHEESLELLTKVKKIAEINNWPKELFLSYNNIGLNYYLMLDYGEALKQYLIAHKISIEKLEPEDEIIVLNNIAILYYKEKDYKVAESYFKKAYDIAKKTNNEKNIPFYAANVASIAAATGDVEKAEDYLNISWKYLKEPDKNFYIAQTIKAKIFILQKNYEAAKEICLRELPKLNNPENHPAKITFLQLLSEIYLEEKNYDKAVQYAELIGEDFYSSINEKLISFQYLANIFTESKDLKMAIAYKDSMYEARDSVNQVKNGQVYENSRIKFELQNKEHELAVSQENFQRERKMFIGALIASLLLLLAIVFALFNYWARMKQRKIIDQNNQKIIKLELEQERNQKMLLAKELEEQNTKSLLEKEILKNELEAKNRKLTAKALSLSSRNEILEDVIKELSHNADISRNNHLKTQIKELKTHLQNGKEWDEFFTHFEEVNQGYLKKLKEKHPDLNSNDIRYIAYVYMNLTTKEIASLFNITVEACRKRKERISKKINLPEEIDFYDYISSF
jgi:hypothetical protein